ncbi:MAG: EAL domain-containing protein, partial [Alphaproteobacteria bacterium]|nr:EAL domain-containing protein [Alphaproteobacteria bacterium]
MELPKSVSDLMMENIQECVVLYDSQGHVIWANKAFEEKTGYKPSEVVGKSFGFLKSGMHHPNMYGDVWYKIVSGMTWHGDIIERDKYGALYPVAKTIIPLLDEDKRFYLSISMDISRQEEIKERLVFFNKHDRLTGLLTRPAFLGEIERIIQRTSSRRQTFAMALLNISGLDRVNNLMGFTYCDDLIKNILEHIKRKLSSGAALARLSTNEFAIAFPPHDHISQVMSVITGIIKTISLMSVDANGYDLQLGVRIGMALYPDDSRNAEDLMLCAERALQKAVNGAVANTYVMFTKDIGAEMEDMISLERDLRRGLAADEFQLFLQPQIDIATEEVTGAEALIRWFHPTRGVITPAKFIPLAENNGMIADLGQWVLQEALRQLRGMDNIGVHLPVISVNVSAIQFQRPDFITSVLKALGHAGVDSKRLELEVTESCLMQDTKMSI